MSRFKELIKHRDSILLAEIGALIHDLGKLSERFIDLTSKEKEGKLDENPTKHAKWIFDWYQNLKTLLKNISIKIQDIPITTKKGRKQTKTIISLYELIANHHKESSDKIEKKYQVKLITKDFNISNMTDINFSKQYSLTVFTRSGDGVDSGIDKGATSNANKQRIDHTYISTSFGHEFEKINLKAIEKYREEFIKNLEVILSILNDYIDKNQKIPEEIWVELRKIILEKARETFKHGLGETRRSANDVTLWDHSYSTASLFKSALAGIVLTNKWVDPSTIKWKLLYIRFNGLDYIFKSNKISDILGRYERLNEALNCVRDLLEVYIPIGNEIYRDIDGSYYLIYGELNKNILHEKLEVETEIEFNGLKLGNKSLKKIIEEIFNFYTYGELKPEIGISKESSRGGMNLGYQIIKELQEGSTKYNKPFENELPKIWEEAKEGKNICNVCYLKPITHGIVEKEEKDNIKRMKKKAEDRGLCLDCLDIRSKRVESFLNEIKKKEITDTIWLDEASDENRRVGLIVVKFELDNWLNGMWLNTTFTKTIENLRKDNSYLDKNKFGNTKYSDVFYNINNYEKLREVVKQTFNKEIEDDIPDITKEDRSSVKVKEVLKAIGRDSYYKQTAEKYFNSIINEREGDFTDKFYNIVINKADNTKRAEILIMSLFRKNPSFARIRRVWETTREFFERIDKDIEDLLKIDCVRKRFKIKISKNDFEDSKDKPSRTHAYELRRGSIRFPIVCVEEKNNQYEFLTAEYLEMYIEKDKIKEFLKGEWEIFSPSDYGRKSERMIKINIKEDNIEEHSKYIPKITILKEPKIYICMLPLKLCWDVINIIKRRYEEEFSKVMNRLPIKIGLIAFKRRFPLYIVMDSAKRMIEEEIDEKVYVLVKDPKEDCSGKYIKLNLKGKERKFKVCISTALGDPNEKDKFYPYFVVLNRNGEFQTYLYIDYLNEIKNKNKTTLDENKVTLENPVNLLHVSKLKKDNIVLFEPSIFDFEFIDSNLRRFDIGKKRRHWLFTESENKPKPYLLWDIDRFNKLLEIIRKYKLSTTQIMNLYELLIGKIEEWGLKNIDDLKNSEEFKKFVECCIRDIPLRLKNVEKDDFEFLKESMLSGLFIDFVDLWHTILKCKFEGDEK